MYPITKVYKCFDTIHGFARNLYIYKARESTRSELALQPKTRNLITQELPITVGLTHNATNKGALERIGYAYLTSPLTGVNGRPIIKNSNGKMIQNIFID